MTPPPDPWGGGKRRLSEALAVFRFTGRAIGLVWGTNRRLTLIFAALTVLAGVLPAGIAYVGKLIVDAVVDAAGGAAGAEDAALRWIAIEAGLVALMAAMQRGLMVCDSLLRAQLGHRVNVMILEKSLTLSLRDFEDSEFYDKLTRARREASSRPLGLVRKTFGLIQNTISLLGYAGLLLSFSGWAVLLLAAAAVPAFIAEARFANDAFRLFRWRSPETRQQMYLETVLAREDYAKEVKLYRLGPRMLDRYRTIFARLYGEDRDLTLRRGFWGYVLGLLSTGAFYGTYAWIAIAAAARRITIGEMTMYLLVFKQGQSAFSAILSSIGGMYEDNLYLSNLYEFLEQPTTDERDGADAGPEPGEGVRFEGVSFTYPGAARPALSNVDLYLKPGRKLALVGENGSGKTTLVKLLCRLYEPTEGRILLDGLPLDAWDDRALRRRIGVIFQDFVRYQLLVGENIGAGDERAFDDETRWQDAARAGLAAEFIEKLPGSYRTQLGRWFRDGQELSGGQWQKIALSRAFMRKDADILVLDEPTAAMDAEAEIRIFERFGEMTESQMVVLISHRFSTVRMADEIVVLREGRVVEHGSHDALVEQDGIYARLFSLQAAGYR